MDNSTTSSSSSSIVGLDIIPDPENNQVIIFRQNNIQHVVDIDEDELNIELGLDFNDYYDTDYDDDDEEEEEDYEEDYEDEDEIIQQPPTVDVDQCPAA
ncbi:unnamed protein product [Rotaria socialis]|uniref:Uncharacterized protein n=11 Tax=Rotaria TaxID=231623 RepID=A0A821BDB7_9BILA|nr:unnamed protein product [Rotaria socialis]CAF4590719.1 unnamed protein product [Rotaria socialis]CAF4835224.1 unnamed protein product [Rotaria sp. Silwood2]